MSYGRVTSPYVMSIGLADSLASNASAKLSRAIRRANAASHSRRRNYAATKLAKAIHRANRKH